MYGKKIPLSSGDPHYDIKCKSMGKLKGGMLPGMILR